MPQASHTKFKAAALLTGLLVLAAVAVELEWFDTEQLQKSSRFGIAGVPILVAALWLFLTRRASLRVRMFAYSVAPLLCWLAALFACSVDNLRTYRAPLLTYGQGILFVLGLCWITWLVERCSQYFEARRESRLAHKPDAPEGRVWNPLDPHAWFYGRDNNRLSQSLCMLTSYVLLFFVVSVMLTSMRGGKASYELPGGGGGGGGGGGKAEMASVVQQVQLKKVTRKKLVINPFSSILFNAPPIDEVKLTLPQATEHLYSVGAGKGGAGGGTGSGIGWGDGDGSGFGPGTSAGKVRFLRLEYPGGDWDQDMAYFAGENMLRQYGLLTGQKVAEKEEVVSIFKIKSFPPLKSPPCIYMTGEKNISLSGTEAKILKEYMLDRHGMLFVDNGGSGHFHNQVIAMMQQVLPNVRPTPVPVDDVINRVPFALPFFPYVAPHGGKEPLCWRVDSRIVCYYHPGDIGDAWSDDHAGVGRDVWESCYKLGTNVIFYAHVEYAKWLMSKQNKK